MGMIMLSRLCFPVLVNVSTQQAHISFKHAESVQPLVMIAIIIVDLLSLKGVIFGLPKLFILTPYSHLVIRNFYLLKSVLVY